MENKNPPPRSVCAVGRNEHFVIIALLRIIKESFSLQKNNLNVYQHHHNYVCA
jgi:hypothetical protein